MATVLERPAHFTRSKKTWLEQQIARNERFTIDEMVITPAIAREMLERNTGNRSLNKATVEKYAADIRAGRWEPNGESIKFGTDGRMLDGQHRSASVIEAGAPITVDVKFGLPPQSQETLDQGKTRKAGDILALRGVSNANERASVARFLIAFENLGGRGFGLGAITTSAIKERVLADETINDSVQYGRRAPYTARGIASPSLIAFWHYQMSRVGPVGLQYLDQVVSGESITRSDPAYRVRERLAGFERKGNRASRTEAFLRGWVFHRDGKPMTLVKIMGEFPKI